MSLHRDCASLLFGLILCAGGAALAAEAVHLELKNGSKFDGRVSVCDDASFTFRPAAGGELRIAWKDLDAPSWLVAKKSVVDPKDGRALLQLARFAADNAMRGEAESLLAKALAADAALKPDCAALSPKLAGLRHAEAVALFERGQGFMEKQNWYQALGRFQEARKLEPNYALAINGVGEAYFSMRRMKEARQSIEEAISVDPKCKDALFNRAYLELMELDFKSCLAGLDEVIAIAPAEGRFGTREEVFAEGKKAGIEKPEDAWKKFADSPLIQAHDLRPIMAEVVKGPGFAKEFVATTEHYDLHSDVSQEYADTIAARMELIFAEYERRYSYEKTGEQKTRGKKLRFPVLVFKDQAGYVAWFTRVLRDPALAQASGGVYVPLVKHLIFFQNKTFEDTQLVAWHEGFHQYLDYYVGNVPLWFNEGQAEYYGGSRVDKTGRKLTVGQTEPMRIATLYGLLKENKLQPAEWLMRCPRGEFMRLAAPGPGETNASKWLAYDNYATSWALVHFCIEGENHRWAKSLLAYFKAFCDGATDEEAFQKVWSRVDWNAFNAAFRTHCEWLVNRAIAERDGKEVPPIPKLRRWLVSAAMLAAATAARAAPEPLGKRWVYVSTNLSVDENVDRLEALMDRASKDGFNGIALNDSKFGRLSEMDARYFRNVDRVKKAAKEAGIEIVPGVAPIGYSESLLCHDPNLAEALPVKDALFVVKAGEARCAADPAVVLRGGDFESANGFAWKDDCVDVAGGVAHFSNPPGNARIAWKVRVPPFRQYHVTVRAKTSGFQGDARVNAIGADGRSLVWSNLGVKPDEDWSEHHAVFNSLAGGELTLYLGVWGGAKGTLSWDDVRIEEAGLLNVVRRAGAPLVVRVEGGKPLAEGTEYDAVADPKMGTVPWPGGYEVWHTPPSIKTSLPDGTKLRVSYFHTITVGDGQVMICPSEQRTVELLRDQMKRMHAAWGATGYFLQHDEIRVLGWDDSCARRKLTAGQILAENVKTCIRLVREAAPKADVYVWSDMFDPNHNARDCYYLVKDTLVGSWDGLDKDVVVVPWNYETRAESLKFFADRGHRTLIAGYYDGDAEKNVRGWLDAARGVKGVTGIMYTTWAGAYGDLERFAKAVESDR